MLNRKQLIDLRVIHIVIMLATALFAYQFTQWDDALWIPITVVAIIGPFYPGLSVYKARQRVVGSIAGLLVSLIVWFIIHYNYNLFLIITLLLVYCTGFYALQDYTYLIFFITIMLCINFDYLNLFFNNEIVYLVNRSICVLVGVIICLFYEFLVFKRYYANATPLIETERLDELIKNSWEELEQLTQIKENSTRLRKLNQILQNVSKEIETLTQLKTSCYHSFSDQSQSLHIIEQYITKLNETFHRISQIGFKNLSPHL